MTLTALKQAVSSFNHPKERSENASLRDKIIIKHTKTIIHDIHTIINNHGSDESKIASDLKQYLSDVWDIVNGTTLCYTAIPEADVTNLICKVAEYISNHAVKEQSDAQGIDIVKLVMPTVNTISVDWNEQPHLGPCIDQVDVDDLIYKLSQRIFKARLNGTPIESEKDFVLEHITTVHELRAYNALQDAYKQTQDNLEHATRDSVIKDLLVIPDHRLPIIAEEELKIRGAEYLQEIFRKHICGEDGKYLLPISLLCLAEQDKYKNLYYDTTETDEDYLANHQFVSKSELERIYNHSALTRELFEAQERYVITTKGSNDLYESLIQLTDSLHFHSAYGVTGRQESAGEGVYAAIIAFNEYYRALSPLNKEKIPAEIKNHIETLISLSSDPTKNTNATQVIATCVGDRRSGMLGAMKGMEEQLRAIGQDDASKVELIKKSKEEFEAAKSRLARAIEGSLPRREAGDAAAASVQLYSGIDRLGVKKELLNKLQIELEFNRLADCHLLYSLTVDEIVELIDINKLDQILNTIATIEDLVVFNVELSEDRLEALLKIAPDRFVKKFLQTPNDLLAWLISLSAIKVAVMVKAIKTELCTILKSAWNFRSLLKHLTLDQRTSVYESLKNDLAVFMRSARDFCSVLEYLTPAQRAEVYEAFKENLAAIIESGDDFNDVLINLTPDQRREVYELLKDKFTTIIKSSHHFCLVLKYLTSDQYTEICLLIKDLFASIIKSGFDFHLVLKHLNQEQRTIVYDSLRGNFAAIINSGYEFGCVLLYLRPEECTIVCFEVKRNLANIIKSGDDLGRLLQPLTLEQCTAVLESLKDEFAGIIKSGYDLCSIFQHLTPEQRTVVLKYIKDNLAAIIKSSNEFRMLLAYLLQNQRTEVYELLQDKFADIIKSGYDFCSVLEHLTPDQRIAVYELFEGNLTAFIKSCNDFRLVLTYLTPVQRTVVYNLCKDNLAAMIITRYDFCCVLEHLTLDQRTEVFNSTKIKLSTVLKEEEVDRILYLTEQQRTELKGLIAANMVGTTKEPVTVLRQARAASRYYGDFSANAHGKRAQYHCFY